jgi:hypothetical protein
MTDAQILACIQRHDQKLVGRRGQDHPRTALEDAAEELRLPYSRVRDVWLARMMNGFGG